MPRPNPGRQIQSESNLAERIAFERSRRGLSYEALAKAMTDAGCPIQGSAIYRIEKGEPPRRVTVDELVALATVLEVDDVRELLTPIGEVEERRAREIAAELHDAADQLDQQARDMLGLFLEFCRLRSDSVELGEYIANHHKALGTTKPRAFADEMYADLDQRELQKVETALQDVFNHLMKAAGDATKVAQ